MKAKVTITKEQGLASLAKLEELKASMKGARYEERKRIEALRDQAIKDLIPFEGMPCTMAYYSDYRASTVVEVVSPCKILARHNKTKCLDYYAGDYEIHPELEGGTYCFTKRSNGRWILEGHRSKDGVLLALHYQRHYIDPSF